MKQTLCERIKSALVEIPEDRSLFYIIGGMAVTLPMFIVGSAYAFAYIVEEIPKVVEYVSKNPFVEYATNNPYEAMLGIAGVTALGIGAYKYIERKFHVAKTLDDFVERAKRSENLVNVHFQCGRGFGSYDESIKLTAGKIRYEYVGGQVETFGCPARAKAAGVLSLIETTIILAEDLQKKGLNVTIRGKNIQYAKDYLEECDQWIKSGHAFIAG